MPKSRALNQWVCFLTCRSLDALFTCNSSTNSEPMRLPSLCMQALGLGYFTVCTNRAAEQSIHSDINLLRNSGAWLGGARAPHILCVCSGRCAPASPTPKPLATISVAMYKTVFRLLALLPLRTLHTLGTLLGRITFRTSDQYARRTRENLRQSRLFADEQHYAALLDASISEAGKSIAELPWIWCRPLERVCTTVLSCQGWEHVAAAHARGKGIILLP